MAAYVSNMYRIFSRQLTSVSFHFRQYRSCLQRLAVKPVHPPALSSHQLGSSAASRQKEADVQVSQTLDRYKQRPWDYLESEEYVERYGSSAVWAGYRRNHKGGIPPQTTRKTCIRGDKICGNPCPVCRDPNIIIHHQNVKLLQQFISPHTGMVYDPTLTGVCMKQQKKLNEAIDKARDDGMKF
ncbi:28S ribosomal protein S18b, mitochondrial [Characodon lateralis]|uniref:Small ribosomal subunit protein mS40 n=1 Tax=Characodon lateralis TaxID=208331 RepID=A0ABU7CQS4_9TELE|nr:28S ribosomal protein S18b, mitochondrial [Characodon lateralis]